MYIYVYIHVYTYVYMYIYIYICVFIYTDTHIYMYTYMYIYVYIPTYIYVHILWNHSKQGVFFFPRCGCVVFICLFQWWWQRRIWRQGKWIHLDTPTPPPPIQTTKRHTHTFFLRIGVSTYI